MKAFFNSITFLDPVALVIMLALVVGRFALMICLRKSFLEEKTIRIINWIASIFVGVAALALFFIMAQNTARYQ